MLYTGNNITMRSVKNQYDCWAILNGLRLVYLGFGFRLYKVGLLYVLGLGLLCAIYT